MYIYTYISHIYIRCPALGDEGHALVLRGAEQHGHRRHLSTAVFQTSILLKVRVRVEENLGHRGWFSLVHHILS